MICTTLRGDLLMDKSKNKLATLVGFMDRVQKDHVGAYAAQAAYFLFLSFIPFILFLTTLIRYTPLTFDMMQSAVNRVIPEGLQSYVSVIIREVYYRSSAMVPLSALTTLWSAGKGLQSITSGLNTIYHVRETRNWLMTRIQSVFYTLLFVVALIACLLVWVLGSTIQAPLMEYVPILGRFLAKIREFQYFWVLLILVGVFLFLYKCLPNRKASFKSQLPGALLTAVAWLGFSYVFSLYFKYWPRFSNMYGSLTAIIMLMLWLYGCMNIVLYGAEINAYFEGEFRKAQEMARELFEREKAEKVKEDSSRE